jgi:branched-chain amino acid transport system ATP-binding protein
MLIINNLSTAYGNIKAIDDISFKAETGKITTIIGANGAGKSTLLRSITALEKPSSGSITWEGVELIGQSTENIIRSGISHVPEGHAVISQLSVEENISIGSLFRARKSAALKWPAHSLEASGKC